ncbi:MAG: DMT family protein [Alphaproteobacteria bacterium]
MTSLIPVALIPVVLLLASNVFMTFAWYGQLKFPNAILWQVVLISWGIAFFEYCLAVPANRIGHQVYSAAQLKTMQEIITLLVFGVFSVTYLGETLRWNHMVAFLFLCGAAFFSFHKWS